MAWLASNMAMCMHDVAMAWMMAALTDDPLWVALVQTAASAPVFLLGLWGGALADRLNRRNFLLLTQLWLALVACVLVALALTGALGPHALLVLAFAGGVGLSLRWPTYSASVPQLVPRAELSPALALNGIAMNSSRVLGPMLAGALITLVGGPLVVFALNAVVALLAAALIARWPAAQAAAVPQDGKPPQSVAQDMWEGVRYLAATPALQAVLARAGLFFFHSAAAVALAPLVGKSLVTDSANGFTLLVAGMGAGAILMGTQLQRIRRRHDRDTVAVAAGALMAVALLVVAHAPVLPLAVAGMVMVGGAWMASANSFTLTAQLMLPNWVRARGIAFYQMIMMGGMAVGSAFWGWLASVQGIQTSLTVAAASMMVVAGMSQRWFRLERPGT